MKRIWFSVLALALQGCHGGGGGSNSTDIDGGGVVLLMGTAAAIAWSNKDTLFPSTDNGPLEATRLFAGRGQFDPSEFATYGIVAFPTSPTTEDASRFMMFCQSYVGGLNWISEDGSPPSRQAVTVWPVTAEVSLDNFGNTLASGCTEAIKNYDTPTARQAILAAELRGWDLSGMGPFFLAWSLGETFGDAKNGKLLVYDMSAVTDAHQAATHIRQWSKELVAGPDSWDGDWDSSRRWISIQRIITNFGRPIDRYLFEGDNSE